ncbi:MAG: NAD(P)H-hydrate epimerase [Aureliella sp.]
MTPWQRLSRRTLSVAAIRQVDRIAIEEFHMHSLVLMENAAAACAGWLIERYDRPQRTVILCGRGNNGGDVLAIARHLKLALWPVEVVVLGLEEKLSADALANWRILTARSRRDCTLASPNGGDSQGVAGSGPADEQLARFAHGLESAEVIVDAMLGSGASGQPRPPLDRWIALANRAGGERIAIDIPTGLDAQTGQVAQVAFRARATLTFVALKPGFQAAAAREVLGEVAVMPIGIPAELVEELLAQSESSGPAGGS